MGSGLRRRRGRSTTGYEGVLGKAMETWQARGKGGGFKAADRTSEPDLDLDRLDVEARVEIRGLGVERAQAGILVESAQTCKKVGVPMSDKARTDGSICVRSHNQGK